MTSAATLLGGSVKCPVSYFYPASTTSRAVALFAADHRIELDYQLVDLFAGEQMQPAFGAINPNQAVPVLEDGDFRLTEAPRSSSTLRKRPARRPIRFVYPQVMPTHKRPDEHAQRQTLAWARRHAVRWLDVLNECWLGAGNRYVCGERITIADYLGIAQITVGEVAHVDYSRWPNVASWIARMKDRPTWAQVNDAFYRYLVQPRAEAQFEAL